MRKSPCELQKAIDKLKSEKCALFFDLDGTLLNDKGQIDDLVRCEIEKVRSKNNKIFVNTGRAKGFLPKGLASDRLFSGFICGGAYAELEGEVLFNTVMSENARRQIIDFSLKNNVPLIFEGVNENYSIGNDFREGFVNITESKIEEFCVSRDVMPTKATFFTDLNNIDCSEINQARVIKFAHYAEALSLGCDKAKAMYRLLDKIVIPYENSISFGDSENDNEMLDFSGISVAMPHSPDSVKNRADIVDDIVSALRMIFG